MNRIHDTAIIGADVTLGDDNVIGPYTVISGAVSIGDGNWIGPHASIGSPAEIRGAGHPVVWDGEPGIGPVAMGDRNVVRDFVTIHAGHYGTTVIGDDGYLMNHCYIPHDAHIGNRVTVSGGALIGGHCAIGDGSNLGMGATVHQRLAIGAGAMIGMGAVVTRHIAPFALSYGNPARVHGANRIGLQRAGHDAALIDALDRAHRDADRAALEDLVPELMATFETQIAGATR